MEVKSGGTEYFPGPINSNTTRRVDKVVIIPEILLNNGCLEVSTRREYPYIPDHDGIIWVG